MELPAMKDTRKRTFFWLGVFVFPMFWCWFTLDQRFNRSQRIAAFSWLAVTLLALGFSWPDFIEHMKLVGIGYPIIVGWVTIALTAWLLYRTGHFSLTIFELFFGFLIIGPYVFQIMDPFYRAIGTPFHLGWLIPPTILVLLHLGIGSLKRAP